MFVRHARLVGHVTHLQVAAYVRTKSIVQVVRHYPCSHVWRRTDSLSHAVSPSVLAGAQVDVWYLLLVWVRCRTHI